MSITGTRYASTRIHLAANCIVCDDALADFTITECGYRLTSIYVGSGEMTRAACLSIFGGDEINRIENNDEVAEALDVQVRESAEVQRMEAAE